MHLAGTADRLRLRRDQHLVRVVSATDRSDRRPLRILIWQYTCKPEARYRQLTRCFLADPMGVASEVVTSLREYLKAQMWNAVIVLALYIAGFALMGVPWWPLIGFVAGLLNLIPHLGPLLALALPLLVKWLSTDGLMPLVWIGLLWLAIQTIDGFVLSPRA